MSESRKRRETDKIQSDAIRSALAAAEERGRAAERERCANALALRSQNIAASIPTCQNDITAARLSTAVNALNEAAAAYRGASIAIWGRFAYHHDD